MSALDDYLAAKKRIKTGAASAASANSNSDREKEENKGGFLGALGYIGASLAHNVVSTVETLGRLGKLAGAFGLGDGALGVDYGKNAAELAKAVSGDQDNELTKTFNEPYLTEEWHRDIVEEYNPTGLVGDIVSFTGDVVGSIPQTALAFIPVVGTGLMAASIFGGALSGAVQETGELGFKELGYAAVSGGVEFGLEKALGVGKASGVTKTIGKKLGLDTAKAAGKTAVRQGLAKQVLTDAAEEFLEESTQEVLDVGLQRLFQIDPDASTSLKDVLYAGAVGAVSGGVMSGTARGIGNAANGRRGKKIIKSGNADKLVNTANMIADRLAADGTNFAAAPEWISVLRGEVDAYNALSPENKTGAQGRVILGEMQQSLFRAELQYMAHGTVENIKAASEQDRAALAEYVNMTIGKDGKKTYTAEDVANDTDGITSELAILQMAGAFLDYEGAVNSVSADAAQESGIERVIAREKAAEAADTVAEGMAASVDATVDTAAQDGAATSYSADLARRVNKRMATLAAETGARAGAPVETDTAAQDGAATSYSVDLAKRVNKRMATLAAKQNANKAAVDAMGANVGKSSTVDTNAQETANLAAQDTAQTTVDTKADPEAARAAARKRAESWLEWDRKTAPTTAEMNTAREYVKNFDGLENHRRLAIIRTVRSANESGVKVDPDTLKAVANVMAVNPKSDLEVRFTEGLGVKNGFYTTIGDKSVIVLDGETSADTTVEGTFAHELIHYLEGRAGFKAFSSEVRRNAKPEEIERIRQRYDELYRDIYTEEELKRALLPADAPVPARIAEKVRERMESEDYRAKIDGEITATLAGRALRSERFLKRYAQRDEGFIRRVKRAIEEIRAERKLTSEERATLQVIDNYAQMINGLLQMPTQADVKAAQEATKKAVEAAQETDGDAGEKKTKSGEETKYSFSSIAYTFFGDEDMNVADFEAGNYKKTEGYKKYVDECLNNMKQSRGEGFSEKSARREIADGIDGIVRVAVAAKKAGYDIYDTAGQRNAVDSKKRLLFSSLEPNSDYFTSHDISTICDKRKNFTEIEAEINRIEAERGVPREKRFFNDINNYFVLHDILARHGLTTACRQCYVESMRKNLGRMANAFIDLVTETDENNKKNKQLYNNKGEKKSGNAELRLRVREYMEGEGISYDILKFEQLTDGNNLADLRLQYPLLYEAYNSFYGQSKPKMPKSATPYRFGELTALLTDDNGKILKSRVDKINATGGFRLQSYSDFQIKNFVDVLQVIFEAGTLGLSGHAYTKVPAFLTATEGTNLKRNISIFMYRDGDEWRIDRKDSFPWALDKIYEVVNADKSGDTGIIAVSQNEDMSAWIMANDMIGYGIPFHKSGTKMGVVRETVVHEGGREIKGYRDIKDHTRSQSEVYASGADKGKKVKTPINIYTFWDFDSQRLSRKGLIEKNVKRYIDECEKAGYLPKFREYVMNNDKILKNTLAYAKKLGYASDGATVSDISFKYKGYTIPYGYYKFLGDFGMFTPDGKASPHKVLSLKDYNFDKAVEFFADHKKLRTNELLQQIDNGPEREKYRKMIEDGKMTLTELGQEIKKRRDAVVAEALGDSEVRYSVGEDGKAKKGKAKKSGAEKSGAEKSAGQKDYTLDENGEVKDQYFLEAVMRAEERNLKQAQNTADAFKEGNLILNEKLADTRKLYNDLYKETSNLEDRIHFLENQNEAYKEGNRSLNNLLREARAKYRVLNEQLFDVNMQMREVGYENEDIRRKLAQREKQIKNQASEIKRLRAETWKTAKQNAYLKSNKTFTIKECKGIINLELVSKYVNRETDPPDVKISEAEMTRVAKALAQDLNNAFSDKGKGAEAAARAAATKLVDAAVIENPDYEANKNRSRKWVALKSERSERYVNRLIEVVSNDIFNEFVNIGKYVDAKVHNNDKVKIDNLRKKLAQVSADYTREIDFIRQEERERSARVAEQYARAKEEFGKVYDAKEVRAQINNMIENGRLTQFIGGQYGVEIPRNIKNGIVNLLTIELNTNNSEYGYKVREAVRDAAREMVSRMTFTVADDGGDAVAEDGSQTDGKKKKEKQKHLSDLVDKEWLGLYTEMIEKDIWDIIANTGKESPYASLKRKYAIVEREYIDKAQKSKLQKALGEELPKTYQAALKLKKLAQSGKGTFSDGVEKIIGVMGKTVDERGHLHFGRIDSAMNEVALFIEGELLKIESELKHEDADRQNLTEFGRNLNAEAISGWVDDFQRLRAGREGKQLTAEEMKLVRQTFDAMRITVERYNREKYGEHWVDVDKLAQEKIAKLISFAKVNNEYKTKLGRILGGTIGHGINKEYFYKVLSPETVLSALEGFEQNGALQTMFHSIRVAEQRSLHLATQMLKPFYDFLDAKDNRWESRGDDGGRKGKKYTYREKLNVKTINVNGNEITLGEGIYLYMLTRRAHAEAGLINGGYVTYDKDGKAKRFTIDDLERARDMIYTQLDKSDRAFLAMAETFFNKTASKIKYDADMEIFGYSNNQSGYYVPIIRDRYSRMKGITDQRFSINEIMTIYSPSFTKKTVANARALEGRNIMSIIDNHARGLADYSELYLPLKAFDRIYNRAVTDPNGRVTSIREVLNQEIWVGERDNADKYLKDLFGDIQHQRKGRDGMLDRVVGKLRSSWVNSVLGANIKVLFTQLTSLAAATQVIKPIYVVRGLTVFPRFWGKTRREIRDRAYKYTDILEARAFDGGAIKAQGNIEKLNKLGEKTTVGIGFVDEQVCLTIFRAAEIKVEKETGHKRGTGENAKLAGKIVDDTMYTTQAMSGSSERSALQRSDSEIGKTLAMFTSDLVKQLSHAWGNVMKLYAHSERAKTDETYKAMLKQDRKDVLRSMRTLAMTGVMMGLITQMFTYLYGKEEDEPEERAKDFSMDIIMNTLNIFPIISDVIDKMIYDYDISLNVLDLGNDLIESTVKGFDTIGRAASGEHVSSNDAFAAARDVVATYAGALGFPVTPIERTVTGLMRRFAPETIYGYDSAVYNVSYTSDLKKAVEEGDEELAEHILEQLYSDEASGEYSAPELEEIVRLYSLTDEDGKHYDVLPTKIPETVDGVKLTRAQRRKFEAIYNEASAAVNEIIQSDGYLLLDDESKAKAIRDTYKLYYDRAAVEVLGREMSVAVALSYLTDGYEQLNLSKAYKETLEEKRMRSGRVVTVKEQFADYVKDMRLSKADTAIISYANGYRGEATTAQILKIINSSSLPDDVLKGIVEALGFEIKRGRVVEKEEEKS